MASTGVIALIPARAGSKRVEGKNVRPLAGQPLIAYTIAAALDAGIFERVIVSTDSDHVADVARAYGAEVPFLRPAEFAQDLSPDIDWVEYTLRRVAPAQTDGCFALLRPTSPFRRPATILRAWDVFRHSDGADSLRAVERCKQHPGKMWVRNGEAIVPLLKDGPKQPPWHSMPYQALPEVFVQNASLEIARCSVPLREHTIAGTRIIPFFTEGFEGFDINEPRDWWYAEHLIASGQGELPEVGRNHRILPSTSTAAK